MFSVLVLWDSLEVPSLARPSSAYTPNPAIAVSRSQLLRSNAHAHTHTHTLAAQQEIKETQVSSWRMHILSARHLCPYRTIFDLSPPRPCSKRPFF